MLPNSPPSNLPNGCPNDNGEPLHREGHPHRSRTSGKERWADRGGAIWRPAATLRRDLDFAIFGAAPRPAIACGGGPEGTPLAATRRPHVHILPFGYVSTAWLSMVGVPTAVRDAGGAPCASWWAGVDRVSRSRSITVTLAMRPPADKSSQHDARRPRGVRLRCAQITSAALLIAVHAVHTPLGAARDAGSTDRSRFGPPAVDGKHDVEMRILHT